MSTKARDTSQHQDRISSTHRFGLHGSTMATVSHLECRPLPSTLSTALTPTPSAEQELAQDEVRAAVAQVNTELSMLTEEARSLRIHELVAQSVQDALGEALDPSADLMEAGLDSLGFVDLRNTLVASIGIEMEVTIFFDYRSVSDLSGRVVELVNEACESGGVAATKPGFSFLRTVRPDRTSIPLFLGAPAFGDGPLAYLTLIRGLPTWGQPIFTLERDIELTWPQNAQKHYEQILRIQSVGPFMIGGHSLGGLLAVETGLIFEQMGENVAAVLAFDAPNPMQFKRFDDDSALDSAMSEVSEADSNFNTVHMETVMRSYHYDFESQGWAEMSMAERFNFFEDVVFQSTGRKINAAKMVFESRFGFDMIDFGEVDENGEVSVGAWTIFSGARLKAPLVFFMAEMIEESAFSFSVSGMGRCHGWVWNMIADDLRIYECHGNHFDLLLPNEEGGDLTNTIIPVLGNVLYRWWAPAPSGPATVTGSAAGGFSWVRGVWGTEKDLPMWMDSTSGAWVMEKSGVLSPPNWYTTSDFSNNFFVVGLDDLAWMRAPTPKSAMFVVHDLLAAESPLLLGSMSTQLSIPSFGLHVSPGMVDSLALEALAQPYVQAVYAILTSVGIKATDTLTSNDQTQNETPEAIALKTAPTYKQEEQPKSSMALLIGAYTREGAKIAFHVAHQLTIQGCNAVAVLLTSDAITQQLKDSPLGLVAVKEKVKRESPIYQAMYAKVCSTGRTVPWNRFLDVMRICTSFESQLDAVSNAYKMRETAQIDWDWDMDQMLQKTMEAFEQARRYLPYKLCSAHIAMPRGGHGDLPASSSTDVALSTSTSLRRTKTMF